MEFRRSGQRDERRRRVLIEERLSEGEAAAENAPLPKADAGPQYGPNARLENQPRAADLLPRRLWVLSLLAVAGALLAGGILALDWRHDQWRETLGAASLAPLDASQPGSLASWLAATWLGLAAMVSLQVFSIRRHKLDDYRGRYRLWIWTALALVLASADAATGVHTTLAAVVDYLAGDSWSFNPQVWWMLPMALVGGAIGLRLAIEMRRSRGSLALVIAAALAYASAALVASGLLPATQLGIDAPRAGVTLAVGATLAGHLLSLVALLAYARFVFLEANDLLGVREKSPAEKKPRRSRRKSTDDSTAADSPSPEVADKPSPATKRPTPATITAAGNAKTTVAAASSVKKSTAAPPANSGRVNRIDAPHTTPATGDDDDDAANLSKAERRRLRKEMRRSGRAA